MISHNISYEILACLLNCFCTLPLNDPTLNEVIHPWGTLKNCQRCVENLIHSLIEIKSSPFKCVIYGKRQKIFTALIVVALLIEKIVCTYAFFTFQVNIHISMQ